MGQEAFNLVRGDIDFGRTKAAVALSHADRINDANQKYNFFKRHLSSRYGDACAGYSLDCGVPVERLEGEVERDAAARRDLTGSLFAVGISYIHFFYAS